MTKQGVRQVGRSVGNILALLLVCFMGALGSLLTGMEYVTPFFSCWEQDGATLCRVLDTSTMESTVQLVFMLGLVHLLTALIMVFVWVPVFQHDGEGIAALRIPRPRGGEQQTP